MLLIYKEFILTVNIVLLNIFDISFDIPFLLFLFWGLQIFIAYNKTDLYFIL